MRATTLKGFRDHSLYLKNVSKWRLENEWREKCWKMQKINKYIKYKMNSAQCDRVPLSVKVFTFIVGVDMVLFPNCIHVGLQLFLMILSFPYRIYLPLLICSFIDQLDMIYCWLGIDLGPLITWMLLI